MLLKRMAKDLLPHDVFEADEMLVVSVEPVGDPDSVMIHYENDGFRASYVTRATLGHLIRRNVSRKE